MKYLKSKLLNTKTLNWAKEAWYEAFPAEIDIAQKLQSKRESAKRQNEIQGKVWSDEELMQFENKIPKWKKGAIVFIRKIEEANHKKPRQKFLNEYLRNKYKDNKDFQELLTELEGLKDSAAVMKDNLSQKVLYSNNIMVSKTVEVASKINDRLKQDAVILMKSRDPSFDIDILEKEIRYIFEEAYHNYLCHDLKPLESYCSGEVIGHFRVMIQEHLAKFGVPKYTDILGISYPMLVQSLVTEDKTPVFVFSLNFQEIHCLVDPKDPQTILDGNESRMHRCDYVIYVCPHPNPDVETTGHEWCLMKLVMTNKVKQLI